jgi:hypothetical protein
MKDKSNIVHGIIYVHTNTINGKQYVGQCINGLMRRIGRNFRGYRRKNKGGFHNHFYYAILKYGSEKFKTNVLFEGDISQYVLDDFEKYFIWKLDTFNNGYNETDGGSHGRLSQETKNKLSKINLRGKEKPSNIELDYYYTYKRLSSIKLAAKYDVAWCTILKWLKDYNIPIRNSKNAQNSKYTEILTYDRLNDLYIINKHTGLEISNILNIRNF